MPDLLLLAIDGRAAVITLALLAALLYGLRVTPRAKRRPAPPVVMNHAQTCHQTGCHYPGWVITRQRHDHSTIRVCSGCFDDGQVRGWWAQDDKEGDAA